MTESLEEELPELARLVKESKTKGVSRVVMTLEAFPEELEKFHAVIKWLTEEGFSITIIPSKHIE